MAGRCPKGPAALRPEAGAGPDPHAGHRWLLPGLQRRPVVRSPNAPPPRGLLGQGMGLALLVVRAALGRSGRLDTRHLFGPERPLAWLVVDHEPSGPPAPGPTLAPQPASAPPP